MSSHPPMLDSEVAPSPRSALFLFAFTNIAFLCVFACTWLAGAILVSVYCHNWTWFARSGSIEGIIGAVLVSRSVLRLSSAERVRIRRMNVIETFTEGEFEDQERDSLAVQIGVGLLVAGTLIWAYGDLLQLVFSRA